MNCPTRVGNLKASTVLLAKENPKDACTIVRQTGSGMNACLARIAVEDLVLMHAVRRTSQKGIGQLVRFSMKLSFSIQVYTEK